MDGTKAVGRPQPRLRPRGRARRLPLRQPDGQRGEVAGQKRDLDRAVEGGEVQIQGAGS